MIRPRFGVAALLLIGAPGYAQTLDNGDPLQFNHEYHCNKERVIVGHCRDSDPASFCEVYYPDRTPAHPGYQVSRAEMLGDVLKKLSTCSEAAASQASPRRAPVARSSRSEPGEAADERNVRPAGARDGQAYLSCITNDPEWQPPLTIIIDERRRDVRVSGPTETGSSPNPVFTPTSVDFGFGMRRWHINRVNLSMTTDDFFDSWTGTCKFSAPPKRAF